MLVDVEVLGATHRMLANTPSGFTTSLARTVLFESRRKAEATVQVWPIPGKTAERNVDEPYLHYVPVVVEVPRPVARPQPARREPVLLPLGWDEGGLSRAGDP